MSIRPPIALVLSFLLGVLALGVVPASLCDLDDPPCVETTQGADVTAADADAAGEDCCERSACNDCCGHATALAMTSSSPIKLAPSREVHGSDAVAFEPAPTPANFRPPIG